MVIKNKIKKYIKRFLPFLVLILPFYANATTVNLSITGTINGNSVSKNMYVIYEHGLTSCYTDDNGDPYFDHIFTFNVSLRTFSGSQGQKNYSGLIRTYLKYNLTSSDYISSYIESPFYTEENISASIISESLDSTNVSFNIISTIDNYYAEDSIPLISYNLHVLTSSSVIPAFSNFSNTYTSATGNIFRLSTQDDLATIIASAIDNSSDVESMVQLLNHISTQSDLLTSVLSKVNSLDSTLSTVLTYIINTDTNTADIETLLIRLYSMISGLSSYNEYGNISMDIQAFKEYWISIIQEAIQDVYLISAADQQRANQQNIEVQSLEANVHSLEASYYDSLATASGDISWNIISPARVVNATTWIISFLDDIYARLDSIQFLITIACTMGLLVLILGGAIRYYRRGR